MRSHILIVFISRRLSEISLIIRERTVATKSTFVGSLWFLLAKSGRWNCELPLRGFVAFNAGEVEHKQDRLFVDPIKINECDVTRQNMSNYLSFSLSAMYFSN